MECQVTEPLSSNQIIEVGLRKPKCFDFENNTLNDWLKFISEELCCLKENFKEEIIEPVVNSTWTIYRQPKLYKLGNFYKMSGEIGGGSVTSTLFSLPFTPSQTQIFPIAHEFDPSDSTDYQVYIKISVDRTVKLYFTGTSPGGTSSKLYLDNISFFVE